MGFERDVGRLEDVHPINLEVWEESDPPTPPPNILPTRSKKGGGFRIFSRKIANSRIPPDKALKRGRTDRSFFTDFARLPLVLVQSIFFMHRWHDSVPRELSTPMPSLESLWGMVWKDLENSRKNSAFEALPKYWSKKEGNNMKYKECSSYNCELAQFLISSFSLIVL